MTLRFDSLVGSDSPWRHLDPRWKLVSLGTAAVLVAALRSVPSVLLALAGALGLVLLSRLSLRWFRARVAVVALFLAPVALAFPLLISGEGWALGPVRLSYQGLELAVVLCAKAVTILGLICVCLATAPLDTTLKAAHALRVPGLFIQLAVLTYRYVFLLSEESTRLRVALRVRGYRNRATLHCYRTVGHVAGTLLVRGHERAERVGQAMRCRGFDGRFRSLASFRTRVVDVVASMLILGWAIGLLALDWALSGGRGP
jgi:cobalt/nickel transport system permease protein